MKHSKRFNESTSSVTESQVEDYLKSNFDSEWFDSELSERVYDYISEEDAEDYDGDLTEAYKNLSTGGAIEYDLLEVMSQEASKHFDLPMNQKIESRSISDICNDHLMDTCTWFDKWVFDRRSTEPYKSKFGGGYEDLMKNIDW